MICIDRKEDCCGCQACAQVCPKHCISMQSDEEGFLYPRIDMEQCVHCGLCEKVCPVRSAGEEPDGLPEAYAAYDRREDVRLASSSGGVFSLLAEKVLAERGVVYGAAMEDVNTVKHIRVSQPDGLSLLRGSKYVQSDMGTAYSQAREDLLSGKTVLFTGTPCQIEGLRGFLGKEYPNLLCVDIVCHGVPAPEVWRSYVRYRENRAKSPAVRVSFRNKKYGWKDYCVVLDYANGKTEVNGFREDLFMRAYLHDLCLRPSCYECRFKKCNRVSDLTLADFWGIEQACPQMDDDKGTSLLLVHSEKGKDVLQKLFDKMEYRQVDFAASVRRNPSMVSAVKKPEARDLFLRDVKQESFPKAVRRYVKQKPNIKRMLKVALRKRSIL